MTSPNAPSLNIALMLKENLPSSVRALDEEIRRTEQRLDAMRKERTTLTQISIAAGIDLTAVAPVASIAPDSAEKQPPANTEPSQVAA